MGSTTIFREYLLILTAPRGGVLDPTANKAKKNLPGKGGKETREALNDIQQTERITLAARLSNQKQVSVPILHHQYTFKITINTLAVKVFGKLLPKYDFHSKIAPWFEIYSCFAAGTETFVAEGHISADKACQL
ncbi:MAG: hypothetical protein LBE10_06915 [Treponema sp.]|nr:hypothetical protein [Treponema sp.]